MIPGIAIRFGLDGIIGLVPGLGDVVAGLLSLVIPLAAWIRGVPYFTLARMAANPRNYRLLCRHLSPPRRHTWRDWVFLFLLASLLALVFALPVLLALWMLAWLISR